MATIILTAGQTEDDSDEFTVTSGSEELISLYTDDGSAIPYGVVLTLQRKTVANEWQDVATVGTGRVYLRNDCANLVIGSAGTYRVTRLDISDFGVNVGVEQE